MLVRDAKDRLVVETQKHLVVTFQDYRSKMLGSKHEKVTKGVNLLPFHPI